MTLNESFKKQGAFLFRWRSYLPLLAIPMFIPALFQSEYIERAFGSQANNLWEGFCVGVSLSGLLMRSLVAGYAPRGTSGRNVHWQVAETLNTTGMYSIVRNPLYVGNFLIALGLFLFVQCWWMVLIAGVGFYFYYERIVFTEEDFLQDKFGSVFLKWAGKTPVFWPSLKNWQRPDMRFSFKTVARREFSTFFSVIASFTFFDVLVDLLSERKLEIKTFWMVCFVVGLAAYCAMVVLKKKTAWLNVEGR